MRPKDDSNYKVFMRCAKLKYEVNEIGSLHRAEKTVFRQI